MFGITTTEPLPCKNFIYGGYNMHTPKSWRQFVQGKNMFFSLCIVWDKFVSPNYSLRMWTFRVYGMSLRAIGVSPSDHPAPINFEDQPPPIDAPHQQFDHRPGSSSDSLGSHVDGVVPRAGSSSDSGDHVASPANPGDHVVEAPSGESELPFSVYDVVDLDDIDGESMDGEPSDGEEIVMGSMPDHPIPGPSLASASSHIPGTVGNLDPASIAQRKEELAAKIAELRWKFWENNLWEILIGILYHYYQKMSNK